MRKLKICPVPNEIPDQACCIHRIKHRDFTYKYSTSQRPAILDSRAEDTHKHGTPSKTSFCRTWSHINSKPYPYKTFNRRISSEQACNDFYEISREIRYC
jgi:hypothetical protein